jgi:hypothetical protein
MYKTVLNEASTVDDLRDWLDERTLVDLWPRLWLPPRLRQLWESKFGELGQRKVAA